MKTLLIVAIILFMTGCATSPYNYTGADPVLMDYSARMLNTGGGGGFGGYGYAQPAARMQTTCIQQGPWTQCY